MRKYLTLLNATECCEINMFILMSATTYVNIPVASYGLVVPEWGMLIPRETIEIAMCIKYTDKG